MEISDPDYRPGRDYLSNGEIEATGKLIGGAVANICRELLERRKADRKQVFTPEQVHNLNRYQSEGRFHPFTCGSRNRTEHPDKEGILVATIYGWVCPYCEYTQDWAHDFMKRPQEGE